MRSNIVVTSELNSFQSQRHFFIKINQICIEAFIFQDVNPNRAEK